jgi:asparagine synthase (glutamine-hydrolysing)
MTARSTEGTAEMCGIVGVVGDIGAYSDEALAGSLAILTHRGPDDEGMWRDRNVWLGNRRLSIIGLGPAGRMPMVGPAGVVVTYNGEIYNFLELRAELEACGHDFLTQTDTEVLVHAYLEWGVDAFRRLNGMWAVAIWDPRTQELTLSRDRLGVKPLVYSRRGSTLLFGSEPKALLMLDPRLRTPDPRTIYLLLAEGSLGATDRTFYQGILTLPPGSYASFKPGDRELRIRRFWQLPDSSSPSVSVSFEDSVTEFGDLFEDSVRIRLRSDVPVGFTLSGGLDSSAIVATSARLCGTVDRLVALTSVYTSRGGQDVDERQWAKLVVERVGGLRLEEVESDGREWLQTLSSIAWHMDGPGYSPAVYPLWMLMHRARDLGVPVLLDGQGADELLGGYVHYAATALLRTARGSLPLPFRWPGLGHDLRGYRSTFGAGPLGLNVLRTLFPALARPYRRRLGGLGVLRPSFVAAMHGVTAREDDANLEQTLAGDLTKHILPALLNYGDAISMAHGIETRLPFLDYRLVEYCARLPLEFRIGRGDTKRLLRQFLRRVGLPEVAARRDKQGYPTPITHWLAQPGVAEETYLDHGARIQEYVDQNALRRLVKHQRDGSSAGVNHLYRLLTTELWLRSLDRWREP